MFCPEFGTENSSSPGAFGIRGNRNRSHAMCHPYHLKCRCLHGREMEALCLLQFCAITEQRICAISTFKSICKWW